MDLPSFELLPSKKEPDKHAPTVAFLDTFEQGGYIELNGRRLYHGDISERPAAAQGFNTVRLKQATYRLQETDINGHILYFDFYKPLQEIEQAVSSGQLQLGKGDVLNVSLGNNVNHNLPPEQSGEPTFKLTSILLGMDVTPANLSQLRPQILERMKVLSQDPSVDKVWQARLKGAVAANEAIDKLQARGIEVVKTAGNDGPDRFSWDFLNAKHQLGSAMPDGTPDPTSGFNSLTKLATGKHDIRYQMVDALDPTPIESQTGYYQIGDTKAHLLAKDYGGLLLGTHLEITRGDGTKFYSNAESYPNYPRITPELLWDKHNTAAPFYSAPPAAAKISIERVINSADLELLLRRRSSKLSETAALAPSDDRGVVIESVDGTSFANVPFLPTQFDRLKAIKNARLP